MVLLCDKIMIVSIRILNVDVQSNESKMFQMEQESSCGAKPKLLDLFPSIQKVNNAMNDRFRLQIVVIDFEKSNKTPNTKNSTFRASIVEL